MPPLQVCLNEILTRARAPGRLYEQFAPTGGQELAVAYATPDERPGGRGVPADI